MQREGPSPLTRWQWTFTFGMVGLPVGAFYGLFVLVQLNRAESVFGGYWEGLHWGVPLGMLVGLCVGMLAGFRIGHIKRFGWGKYKVVDCLAVAILVVKLLFLTWNYVVPAFFPAYGAFPEQPTRHVSE